MRRTASLLAALTMAGGLVSVGGAAAVAAPQGAAGAATIATAQADCVKVVRWYNSRSNRMVEVRNNCARTACFTVTLDWRKDPKFSIGPNRQDSFRYAGTLWTKGTGIKNVAC
ncbi:hypothetical protein [Streptomyces sp. TRM64462]|uniref:hypothetical protein n=1 Tax=Streptomyces sp. TRM64462 TaxID=2741726 RepID=UPI0020C76848|nr:hypothetical protein [Streptomyces sp. TRM64462]